MSLSNTDCFPLHGITVIEFCNVAAGPFCGMLLADMGANVIKVEAPSGDTLRQWPPLTDGYSENFASLNRNKRSIALDLKDSKDNSIARELIAKADVVIENNRPGVMSRLNLGYERFSKEHPKLIYCSLSAYGQSGPRSAGGGFDLTIQAMSGIMSVTGDAGGKPAKAGVPISDFATGLYGAFAIASLVARIRAGGEGGHIDVSMLGSSMAIAALQISEFFGTGVAPIALGAAHPRNAPYQAFSAADGDFVMAAGNDKLWKSVCDIIDQPELAKEPRFLTTTDRARNQTELEAIINRAFADRTVKDVIAVLEQAGVPCSRINSYSEALQDEQVEHNQWVQKIGLPSGREISTFGPVISVDGVNLPIRSDPPVLNAHRTEILEEYGLSEAP